MATNRLRFPQDIWTETPKWARRISDDKTALGNPSFGSSGDPGPSVTQVTADVTPPPRCLSSRRTPSPPPWPQEHDEQVRYFLCLHAGAYRIVPLGRIRHMDCTIPAPTPPLLEPPAFNPEPRLEQRCVASALPDELWIEILSYLDSPAVLALRPVSTRLAAVALHPSLHRRLDVELHRPLRLTAAMRGVVRHVRDLHVTSELPPWRHGRGSVTSDSVHPTSRLVRLLHALPEDKLLSLVAPNLAHGAHWGREHWRHMAQVGAEIRRTGGRLEVLNLANAGLQGHDLDSWGHVGARGRGLRNVDLSNNLVDTIPGAWRLERLSLRYCSALPRTVLDAYLGSASSRLRYLDLTGLHQLTMESLVNLPVTIRSEAGVRPTPLREVRLVGIDNLTRSGVRTLQRHWAAQRELCSTMGREHDERPSEGSELSPAQGHPWRLTDLDMHDPSAPEAYADVAYGKLVVPPPRPHGAIAIVHCAVLETDDEAGYRQYIGEMVDGTMSMTQIRELWC